MRNLSYIHPLTKEDKIRVKEFCIKHKISFDFAECLNYLAFLREEVTTGEIEWGEYSKSHYNYDEPYNFTSIPDLDIFFSEVLKELGIKEVIIKKEDIGRGISFYIDNDYYLGEIGIDNIGRLYLKTRPRAYSIIEGIIPEYIKNFKFLTDKEEEVPTKFDDSYIGREISCVQVKTNLVVKGIIRKSSIGEYCVAIYCIADKDGTYSHHFKHYKFLDNKNINKMEKKIIGYKSPVQITTLGITKDDVFKTNNGNTYYSNGFKLPKEVVEGLFEPVYEEEKVTLTLGNQDVMVEVGMGRILVRGTNILLSHLVDIRTRFAAHNMKVNTWSVVIEPDTRAIRIGCESENNLFSLNEIQQVIDTYNKLNK